MEGGTIMVQSNMESNTLVLTRIFEVPRDLLFKVWTDPRHFEKWWGPKGYLLNIVKMEARPGGSFFGSQKSPEGHVMWGKFIYQEVEEPEKLIFIQSFSDEEGNTIRAPFDPNWPLEIINILSFGEDEGKTALTMSGGPFNATDEERTAYEKMSPMLQQGLNGTFDQLTEYLESLY